MDGLRLLIAGTVLALIGFVVIFWSDHHPGRGDLVVGVVLALLGWLVMMTALGRILFRRRS